MVDDDVALLVARLEIGVHSIIFRLCLVPHSATDKADDDVACRDIESVVLQADTVTGSRLSLNGNVRIVNLQHGLQLNDSRYVEDHDARTTGRTSSTK